MLFKKYILLILVTLILASCNGGRTLSKEIENTTKDYFSVFQSLIRLDRKFDVRLEDNAKNNDYKEHNHHISYYKGSIKPENLVFELMDINKSNGVKAKIYKNEGLYSDELYNELIRIVESAVL